MELSNLRTLKFSLPSSDIQLPKSFSSTLRVGLEVIGTSYSQALKRKQQRAATIPRVSFPPGSFIVFMACFPFIVANFFGDARQFDGGVEQPVGTQADGWLDFVRQPHDFLPTRHPIDSSVSGSTSLAPMPWPGMLCGHYLSQSRISSVTFLQVTKSGCSAVILL